MTSREFSSRSTDLLTGRYSVGSFSLSTLGAGEVRLDAGFVHVAGDYVALLVVEVPGPLLAADVNNDVGRLGAVIDRLLVAVGEVEEHQHHEQRDGQVEDLERKVEAGLPREPDGALAAAVGDDAPDQQAPGNDAHDQCGDP